MAAPSIPILFLFLVTAIVGSADDTAAVYPCEGADGARSRLFSDGKIAAEWSCAGGKVEGRAKHFGARGHLTREADYRDGALNGWERLFSESTGQLLVETEFIDGERRGSVRNYEGGLLKLEAQVNGELYDGVVKTYHKSGRIKSEGLYQQGKRVGLHREFFPDGSLRTEANYRDDKKEGRFVEYPKDGGREIAAYESDKRQGISRSFFSNGRLLEEKSYKDDLLHGPYHRYHIEGNLLESTSFILGQRDGLTRFFHENGKLKEEVTFRNGHREGPGKLYHSNGKLAEEGSFQTDKKTGTFKIYNDEGKLIANAEYKDGERVKKVVKKAPAPEQPTAPKPDAAMPTGGDE